MSDRQNRRDGAAIITLFVASVLAAAVILASRPHDPVASAAARPEGGARSPVARALARATTPYVIFGVNDLGMHCYQKDYRGFLILPPANTLKVQVYKRTGEGAALVTKGITVSFKVVNNTHSADKTNFWKFAADYGFNVKPNVGITGTKMSGRMAASTGSPSTSRSPRTTTR
jgi:hypothetical protein